jgi:hypothetical protein
MSSFTNSLLSNEITSNKGVSFSQFKMSLCDALAEIARLNELVNKMKFIDFSKIFKKIELHMYERLIEHYPQLILKSDEHETQYLEFMFEEKSLFRINLDYSFFEHPECQQCCTCPELYDVMKPRDIGNEDRIIEIYLYIRDIDQERLPISNIFLGVPHNITEPLCYGFNRDPDTRTIKISQYYMYGDTEHALNQTDDVLDQFIQTNNLKIDQYIPHESLVSDLDPIFLHRLNRAFSLIQIMIEHVNRTSDPSVTQPFIINIDY